MNVTLAGILGGLLTSVGMFLLAVFMEINLYILVIPAILLFFFSGHIFPNVMGHLLTFFPGTGGTLSAVIGTLMAACIFLLTVVATAFETNSQIPLALMYIGMLAVALLLFLCVNYREDSSAE